jgi:hypothetical protein
MIDLDVVKVLFVLVVCPSKDKCLGLAPLQVLRGRCPVQCPVTMAPTISVL